MVHGRMLLDKKKKINEFNQNYESQLSLNTVLTVPTLSSFYFLWMSVHMLHHFLQGDIKFSFPSQAWEQVIKSRGWGFSDLITNSSYTMDEIIILGCTLLHGSKLIFTSKPVIKNVGLYSTSPCFHSYQKQVYVFL